MKQKLRFIYKVLLKKIYNKYGYESTLLYIDSMKSINDDMKILFKNYIEKIKK